MKRLKFKEAREKKQKTVWKVLDGNYTLFVDDKQNIWELE